MKYNIYAVRDVYNGFGVPICDYNDKSATRNFRISMGKMNDVIRRDYDLYKIGVYDVESGIIQPEGYPVLVFRGCDCEVDQLAKLKKDIT